ncbi:hypothetical protein AGMMS4957_10820 [Bacteroidia bacterium]|nr:hypothetical protein AGMMS4957_10820 [Bacteroidia bacterium]
MEIIVVDPPAYPQIPPETADKYVVEIVAILKQLEIVLLLANPQMPPTLYGPVLMILPVTPKFLIVAPTIPPNTPA